VRNRKFITAPMHVRARITGIREEARISGKAILVAALSPFALCAQATEHYPVRLIRMVIFNGIGSTSHLASFLFASAAGFKNTHVPYKGGRPSAAAIGSGEAHCIREGYERYGKVVKQAGVRVE
jgi:tripartite-type tricarboxylate transporter receptor subunit TctC